MVGALSASGGASQSLAALKAQWTMPSSRHHEFMGLNQAARHVFHAVSGIKTDNAVRLNNVARMISRHVRIFTRANDREDFALVMPSQIDDGVFQLGGACLEMPAPRPALGNLTILAREFPVLLNVTVAGINKDEWTGSSMPADFRPKKLRRWG
jgi:hypothetical protein